MKKVIVLVLVELVCLFSLLYNNIHNQSHIRKLQYQ